MILRLRNPVVLSVGRLVKRAFPISNLTFCRVTSWVSKKQGSVALSSRAFAVKASVNYLMMSSICQTAPMTSLMPDMAAGVAVARSRSCKAYHARGVAEKKLSPKRETLV